MGFEEILALIPKVITTGEEIYKVWTAVKSGLPVAVQAFAEFKAVVAAGGIVTQLQWTQLASDIDVAQKSLDDAITKAEQS